MTAELSAGPYWGNATYQAAGGWPVPVTYPPTLTVTTTVTLSPPPCGQCQQLATCCYDYGTGSQYACGDHDPTRQPGWMAMATPPGFAYRSLDFGPVVTGTTGHLGAALPARLPA